VFFFEKKNQKLLTLGSRTVAGVSDRRPGQRDKSFLLLFFKKEVLFLPSFSRAG
jgi:hypothetical protein